VKAAIVEENLARRDIAQCRRFEESAVLEVHRLIGAQWPAQAHIEIGGRGGLVFAIGDGLSTQDSSDIQSKNSDAANEDEERRQMYPVPKAPLA
jgi:hypothetical protein